MVNAKEIIKWMDRKFPSKLHASWDTTEGLIQGDLSMQVKSVCLSLELRPNLEQTGADMLILHHPPIFGKDKSVTNPFYAKLKQSKIVIYALHSRLDVSGFTNKALGVALLGTMRLSEPKILTDGTAIFQLKESMATSAFVSLLKAKLHLECVKSVIKKPKIKKIAIHGGEGFNHHHVKDALAEGIDAYLAGDMSHHLAEFAHFFDANFFDINHYTEQVGMKALADALSRSIKGVSFTFIEQKALWDLK